MTNQPRPTDPTHRPNQQTKDPKKIRLNTQALTHQPTPSPANLTHFELWLPTWCHLTRERADLLQLRISSVATQTDLFPIGQRKV
jgi:hypothetical protein